MTGSPVRVSAIVVNYNVADLLLNCLRSLEYSRTAGELDEIIVVDSSSSDNSVSLGQRRFPQVEFNVVPNRGFGTAVNMGLERASGDAVLILNADTVVCPGAISKLSTALFDNVGTGLVGPCLVYPDGTLQSSRRRFPGRWTPVFESTILEEWFPTNRWVRHYRMLNLDPTDQRTLQAVDWLVGAALMVRREAVAQAGGFDESFFLYGEELNGAIGFIPMAGLFASFRKLRSSTTKLRARARIGSQVASSSTVAASALSVQFTASALLAKRRDCSG